jgi:hypothetical protein
MVSTALATPSDGLKTEQGPPACGRHRQPRLVHHNRRPGTTKALTPAGHTRPAGLLTSRTCTSRRSTSNHVDDPAIALHAITASVTGVFQTSPQPSQLVVVPPPNRVRLLRTASSLPVALHPASRRRSYFQLRGLGLPRHGLPPCCVCTLVSALGSHMCERLQAFDFVMEKRPDMSGPTVCSQFCFCAATRRYTVHTGFALVDAIALPDLPPGVPARGAAPGNR